MNVVPVRGLSIAVSLLLTLGIVDSPLAAQDAAPEPANRMQWWREARFGLFIHWGLYAIPGGTWNGKKAGGTGEWILTNAKAPVDEYEKLLPQFNPVKFDARAWARLAKNAGMKYLVITSKHHDGFCLWDSAVTTWDVASSPFKRDILKELKEACDAEGLRFCVYHSIMDWHHEDYLPRRAWDQRPADKADLDRFVVYLKAQLKELVDRYRPGVLWFDGEWEDSWTHARGLDLFRYVRSLDPALIINNRADKGRNDMQGMTKDGDFAGDFGTPEQEVPATGMPGIDWESCMTMNDTWGWRTDDQNWKSEAKLIQTLVDVASKGGNFLLNVGPTPEGLIPEVSVQRLEAMGAWMRRNGESVRATGPTPFKRLKWRCTSRPGRLYVHLFDWPGGTIELRGLKNAVTGARLLADPAQKPLAVQPGRDTVKIGLPAAAPDPYVSVIAVDVEGTPEAIVIPLGQEDDGSVTLSAEDADVHGTKLRYEAGADKRCLGFWTEAVDWASFDFEITKPRAFTVSAEIACDDGSAGSTYAVEVGGKKLSNTVTGTGGWGKFATVVLSRVNLDAGRHTLSIKCFKKPANAVMNLRAIRLKAE